MDISGLMITCISFCFQLLTQNILAHASFEPILVQILFRHGDRSAIHNYPTSPYPGSTWPQGFGQLTQTGMLQHYQLGQYFRERYILGKPYSLLSEKYSRYQIPFLWESVGRSWDKFVKNAMPTSLVLVHIQSTDFDRTLMSAYSHLAGLFPPAGDQIWNKNITWQPIPVHTISNDHVLLTDAYCPTYQKLLDEVLQGDFVKKQIEENKELLNFVAAKAGISAGNITEIWRLYDTLFCQSRHPELGFRLPQWVNKTFDGVTVFEKLAWFQSLEFSLLFSTTEMRRLRGGSLVKELITNMKTRINGTQSGSDTRRYFIFSAHDSTVSALLSALKIYNYISPPYTASVVVELLNNTETGQKYIQIFYRNDSAHSLYNLTLPGCQMLCLLEDFVQLVEPVIPSDWEAECGIKMITITKKEVYIIIAACLVGSLAIAAIISAVLAWRKRCCVESQRHYTSLSTYS